MAMIQDIRPAKSQMAKGRDAALQQIKKFHQATIIPTPTMEPVKRAVNKAMPGKGHYDSFRPHPLIQKYQARNIKPDISPPPRGTRPLATSPPAQAPTPPVRPARPMADIRRPGMPLQPARPVQPAQPVQRPVAPAQPQPRPVERQFERPPAAAPAAAPTKARAKIFDFIQYPLIAAAALGAALSTTVGQIIIGIYLIVAIITKIPSKVTFGAALVLLVCIPFFQVLNLSGTSENAAVYAFEMLVVGTVQALVELWRDSRKERRAHGPQQVAP